MSSDPQRDKKILHQVNFYFGNSNFPRDKFLRGKAEQDPDGWVDLSVIATFARLKALSTDVNVIAEALKSSDVVEVSDDNTKVRRKHPIPEKDDSKERTVFVGRLSFADGIEEVRGIFEESMPNATVLAVRICRNRDKNPLGYAYVEFNTQDDAKKAVTLQIASRIPPERRKSTETETTTTTTTTTTDQADDGGAASSSSVATDGGEDPNKAFLKIMPLSEHLELRSASRKNRSKRRADDEEEKKVFEWTKGLIVHFTGAGEPLTLIDIKPLFAKFGDVKYLDLREDGEGYVRMAEPEQATAVLEGMKEAKVEIAGKIPTLTVLDGQAEEDYWKTVEEAHFARHKNRNKRQRRH
mmetsp:Transcript_20777/g.30924  ORF Transcript_20777/g.30924 Transcript_20777/m.30924 type:complete len:354 (+) Transcript_20777:61-1122(+)